MRPMQLPNMSDADLKSLKIFVAIVENKGFGAAQIRLNMAQSLISEAVKSLEIRLGLRLCERGPAGFRLLPEGERVYEAAIELFGSLGRFNEKIAGLHGGRRGHLKIGIEDEIVSHPACRLPQAIALAQAPDNALNVSIELGTGHNLVGSLIENKLDIVLTILSERNSRLEYDELYKEERGLYCGRSHPLFSVAVSEIAADMLSQYRCTSRGVFERPDFEDTLLSPTEATVAHGADAHLAFALSGTALAALPVHKAESFVEANLLRSLPTPNAPVLAQVVCASRPADRNSAAQKRFRQILVKLHDPSN